MITKETRLCIGILAQGPRIISVVVLGKRSGDYSGLISAHGSGASVLSPRLSLAGRIARSVAIAPPSA